MKASMKILCSFVIALLCGGSSLSAAQQWKDTIVVARDGSGLPHADRSHGGYPGLYGL